MGHLSTKIANLLYGIMAEVGMTLAMIAGGLCLSALLVWWLT